MKRITSDTVQSMIGLWLSSLVFLVVMRVLRPDDPWISMMARPIFLVFAPLLVACIPLLGAKPKRDAGVDSIEYDSDENFQHGAKRSKRNVARRMLLVWLVSLVVFAMPHRNTAWDPILHHPAFLIVAPLLLACIPLLLPRTILLRRATPRWVAWNGIIGCLVGAALAAGVLLLINDTSLAHSGASRFWPNVFFTIALTAALMRAWHFVKLLEDRE